MESLPSGFGEIFLQNFSSDPEQLEEIVTLWYKIVFICCMLYFYIYRHRLFDLRTSRLPSHFTCM